MRRVLVVLGATACALTLPPLSEEPRVVEAAGAVWAQVEAVLPSDVDVLPDGTVGVLDGYAGRVVRLGEDGAAVGTLDGEGLRGAVRLDVAADGDGFWVADPEAGEVRRLGPDGATRQAWSVPGAVDVLDRGDEVAVGLRTGGVAFMDPTTGTALRTVTADVDGIALGTVAGLAEGPDGGLLLADALGHRVHRLDATGEPVDALGRFGMWIGTLSKPKGVALGPDGTRVVVDSALRTVQVFDADGAILGALADEGVPRAFEHPVQVIADGADLLVLDAGAAAVWRLVLPDGALARARRDKDLRHLRHPLVDPDTTRKAAGEARLCLQCHDGFVNDDRGVWDPALEHHPVGVIPEGDIPAFFPRDADGALRCGTCHSPHGLSELPAVDAVEGFEDRADLVRHQAPAGDLFTRLSRDDAQLCRACHDDAAHDAVLERLGLDGAAHPVGPKLASALAAREGEGVHGDVLTDGSCLTCHAPHAAARKGLTRDAATGATCLACHEDATGAHHHPLGGDVPGPRAGAHLPVEAGVSCVTCHALVDGDAAALIRDPGGGRGLCASCHADGPSEGPHARLQGDCGACHAPHDAARPDGLLARVGPETDPLACQHCHAGTAEHGHPVAVGEAPGCTDCHQAHTPVPVQQDCGSCHEGPAQAAARGGHGGLACADCHAPHADPPPARVAANPSSQACLRCHGPGGEATRIEAWSHDPPVFGGAGPRWSALEGLALAAPDGSVAQGDRSGELVCTTCHTVHGPHAEDPGDHLRRPGWEEPCAACHGPEARVRYRWFHDPARRGGE